MLKLFSLVIITFMSYELRIGSIPLNINDIAGIIFGSITTIIFIIQKNNYFNKHTLIFFTKEFKIFTFLGIFIIFIYTLLSEQNFLYSILSGARMILIFTSIFYAIFLMDQIIKFTEKKWQNVFKFFYIIIFSTFILLSLSIFNSILGDCKIVYGGNFCYLNQTSYSGNGYISLALYYINLIILLIINNFKIKLNYLNLSRILIILNLIFSSLITFNSGSRGAFFVLLVVTLSLFYKNITNIIKFKVNFSTLLMIISIVLLSSTQLISRLTLRTFSILSIRSSTEIINLTSRFRFKIFEQDALFFGSGNFGIGNNPLSPSNFDGSLRMFTVSYGLLGLFLFLFMIYALIKHSLKLIKRFNGYGDYKSAQIVYTNFFYILTSSFSNEHLLLNGISIIYTFSFIMPLMLLFYLSNKLIIKNLN